MAPKNKAWEHFFWLCNTFFPQEWNFIVLLIMRRPIMNLCIYNGMWIVRWHWIFKKFFFFLTIASLYCLALPFEFLIFLWLRIELDWCASPAIRRQRLKPNFNLIVHEIAYTPTPMSKKILIFIKYFIFLLVCIEKLIGGYN